MPNLFDQLGSLHAVKQLAHEFYDVMDREPEFAELRALHPKVLNTPKKKLYRILAHWLGGPELMPSEPPSANMLELRHRRVELTDHNAKLWLACMEKNDGEFRPSTRVTTTITSPFFWHDYRHAATATSYSVKNS